MLSFCIGYNVTFATNEDTKLNSQIEQRAITNEDVAFSDQPLIISTILMEIT